MISFTFLPRDDDPSWRLTGMSNLSIRALNADDLTFHYFNSDVVINDGNVEIHLRTPGIPVVDFVLMIVQLCREVASSGTSHVESSQTQDSIYATRRGDMVEITYSFSEVVSTISLDEFNEAPIRALQSALEVLNSTHEEMLLNDYLGNLKGIVGFTD
ncbi:hypothetical protein [Streptomyces globisporus]|uniref:hypothetical protein n=1 Tax=Streptomyces globisporus TaxID=1908 RepID=UPI0037915216|nr:hypothetical protein OG215_05775 [Streptomyces globisporus]